jgi:two-component sensor histidine kinase
MAGAVSHAMMMDRRRGQTRQRLSRLNGLRGRMTLLLLAVLLLPTGLAIYNAVDRYRHLDEQQQLAIGNTARLIAEHRASSLAGLQTWLEQAARVEWPPVMGQACNEALAARRAEFRMIHRLTLVAPDGRIICDADGVHVGIDVGESFWFQRAIRGAVFTVSELLRDLEGNETLVAAVPLYVDDGWRTAPWEPQGVLAAALDLQAFAASERNVDLPPDHDIYLVDRLGNRVPPLPWLDPEREAPDFEALLRGERNSLQLGSADASRSLLVRAPIAFTGLQVIVAAPTGQRGWFRRDTLIPILLPALMLVLGVVAIFSGTHLFVNRHVERLAEAVRWHRPGSDDLARATAKAPNELSELGTRFAGLAKALEEREASLQGAVAQKELLLREVNHRVKNNLQVVASLLRMRARTGQTAESRAAIRDAHARIEAIALVHRRIYEEGTVERAELDTFLGELLDHLRKSIGNEAIEIELKGDVRGVRLITERAVSLALLITEVVSNAIEHAFQGRAGGRITITLTGTPDGGLDLSIADDGIGFDPAAANGGTGIALAQLLARQLGGQLSFGASEVGTRVDLRLPPDELAATDPGEVHERA